MSQRLSYLTLTTICNYILVTVALLSTLVAAAASKATHGAGSSEVAFVSPVAYLLLLDSYRDIGTDEKESGEQRLVFTAAERRNSPLGPNGIGTAPSTITVVVTPLQPPRSSVLGTAEHSSRYLHDFIRAVPLSAADHSALEAMAAVAAGTSNDAGTHRFPLYCEASFGVCVRSVVPDKVLTLRGHGVDSVFDASPDDDGEEESEVVGTANEEMKLLRESDNKANATVRRTLLQQGVSAGDEESESAHEAAARREQQRLMRGVVDSVGTVDVVERLGLETNVWPGRRSRASAAAIGRSTHAERIFSDRLAVHGALSRAAFGASYGTAASRRRKNGEGRDQQSLIGLLTNKGGNDPPLTTADIVEWVGSTAGEGVRVGLFDSGLSAAHEGFGRRGDAETLLDGATHGEEEVSNVANTMDMDNHVAYCRTFTGAVGHRGAPGRSPERAEGTEGCHDGFGHGTFVAGVVGSRGVPIRRAKNSGRSLQQQRPQHNADGGEESAAAWQQKALLKAGKRKGKSNGNKPLLRQSGGNKKNRLADSGDRREPAECRGIAPHAALHAYKTFTDEQISYTSYFLAALNIALQAGLDVVNLSMGGYDYEDRPFTEKALELSAAGIAIVTAAGNDGPHWGTVYNPSDHPDVIAVGAVGHGERLAKFSSRGMTTWELPFGAGRPKPDVVAFGDPIAGASPHASVGGGRNGKQRCRSLSGTSMASPVVAGVLALVTSTLHKRRAICENVCDNGEVKKLSSSLHVIGSSSNGGENATLAQLCAPSSVSGPLFCRRIAAGGANVAALKQILFATSRPLFPFRYRPRRIVGDNGKSDGDAAGDSEGAQDEGFELDAAAAAPRRPALPALLGASSDLTDYTALEHSIYAQGAGLVSGSKAVAYAASASFVPHLSAFPPDLLLYAHPTSFTRGPPLSPIIGGFGGAENEKEAGDTSDEAQRAAEECEYMWPLCAQPLFFTAAPLRANLTLLNSASSVARRRRCYATLRHRSALGEYINVGVDCSERLWPYVGTASVSITVAKPFPLVVVKTLNGKKSGKEENSNHNDDTDGTVQGAYLLPESDRVADFSHTVLEAARRYAVDDEEVTAAEEKDLGKGDEDTSSSATSSLAATHHTVLMETPTYVIVEGTIEMEYETPPLPRQPHHPYAKAKNGQGDNNAASEEESNDRILRTSVPFRIKVLKMPPPRPRRLLWDLSHSIQFPSVYVPRDTLKSPASAAVAAEGNGNARSGTDFEDGAVSNSAAASADFLDWNGDHPHTNYAAMLLHLTKARGYAVDFLASPRGLLETFDMSGAPLRSDENQPIINSVLMATVAVPHYFSLGKADGNRLLSLFGHSNSVVATIENGEEEGERAVVSPFPSVFPPSRCDLSSIASRYGALLIADAEDFFTPRESQRLHELLTRGNEMKRKGDKVGKSRSHPGKGWAAANARCPYVTMGESVYTLMAQEFDKDTPSSASASSPPPTMGLIVASEWYNAQLMRQMGSVDDNTGLHWEPAVGGGNTPALNELLRPFGVQLSHTVLEGRMGAVALPSLQEKGEEKSSAAVARRLHPIYSHLPSYTFSDSAVTKKATKKNVLVSRLAKPADTVVDGGFGSRSYSGVPILPLFASGGTVQAVPLSPQCQWCSLTSSGEGAAERVDGRTAPQAHTMHVEGGGSNDGNSQFRRRAEVAMVPAPDADAAAGETGGGEGRHASLLFMRLRGEGSQPLTHHTGRIALLTDSSCLDMAHHRHYPTAVVAAMERRAIKQQKNKWSGGSPVAHWFAMGAAQYRHTFCFNTLDAMLGFALRVREEKEVSSMEKKAMFGVEEVLDLRRPQFLLHSPSPSTTASSGEGKRRIALLGEEMQCFPCSGGTIVEKKESTRQRFAAPPLALQHSLDNSSLFNLMHLPSAYVASSKSLLATAEQHRGWNVFPCPFPRSNGDRAESDAIAASSDGSLATTRLCKSIAPYALVRRATGKGGDDGDATKQMPLFVTDSALRSHLEASLRSMAGASWVARRRLGIAEADGDDDWDRHRMHRRERDALLHVDVEAIGNAEDGAANPQRGGSGRQVQVAQQRDGIGGQRRAMPRVLDEHYEEEEQQQLKESAEGPVSHEVVAVADVRSVGGEATNAADETPSASAKASPAIRKPNTPHPKQQHPRQGAAHQNSNPKTSSPLSSAPSFSFSLTNPWLPAVVILWALKWYIKIRLLRSRRFRSTVYALLLRTRLLPLLERAGLLGLVRRLGCLPPFGTAHPPEPSEQV